MGVGVGGGYTDILLLSGSHCHFLGHFLCLNPVL
uniref:Uncharacterized protein n=1 Tax=Anguilla anguilla TaxID=7936 RepID=A0A0E9SXU7_ANGAN